MFGGNCRCKCTGVWLLRRIVHSIAGFLCRVWFMPPGALTKTRVVLGCIAGQSVAIVVLDGIDCGFGKGQAEARRILLGSCSFERTIVMLASEACPWGCRNQIVALAAHDMLLQCRGAEGQELCGLFTDLPMDALGDLDQLHSWGLLEPGSDS